MRKKRLRSGYTTGACAAAAAKAAVRLLLDAEARKQKSAEVEIPFPDGNRYKFKIQNSKFKIDGGIGIGSATVIKDAGDDPDITHGAEIVAEVRVKSQGSGAMPVGRQVRLRESGERKDLQSSITIRGGEGVGTVTKPGLAVPVGEAAINPVPRRMIEEAVREAIEESHESGVKRYENKNQGVKTESQNNEPRALEVTISVPDGEELAKKTLNHRLGIEGGISILGTTGIVKPVSTEAWTATISASMDVAAATGQREIVLSAGRASERAHMERYSLPEECYVLMGDYMEYSFQEARRHAFNRVHLCAQWAKMLKIAMATPQTHVRFGAIDTKKAVDLLNSLNAHIPADYKFNTAREIYDYLNSRFKIQDSKLFTGICRRARHYAEEITDGIPVETHLVSYEKDIIATNG